MFTDSDVAPNGNADWFKKAYDALNKCLFAQGFGVITYLDENDRFTSKKKTSFTGVMSSGKNTNLNMSAPGGVYCIDKELLENIGYFNYLPLGGGDILFIEELAKTHNNDVWIPRIQKRELVRVQAEKLA